MIYDTMNLTDLGWVPFFSKQMETVELSTTAPVKVVEVHRGKVRVAAPGIDLLVTPSVCSEDGDVTICDWLLIDTETMHVKRLLKRKSLLRRVASGSERKWQLIAANIDTLFIMSSCNEDFNVARLERYLALALEAQITPVLILTKPDLVSSTNIYVDAASKLLPDLVIILLDARDADSAAQLERWCTKGQTVALVGSSGVGKSTLTNTLTGRNSELTQSIREDDAKGRHTTTSRNLHRLPSGGWLLDTPGMRGVEVTEAGDGIEQVFSDIVSLSKHCRFSDCIHDREPGCAVQMAVNASELDANRLKRWQKLTAEDIHNSASVSEWRTKDRALGKKIRSAQKHKHRW